MTNVPRDVPRSFPFHAETSDIVSAPPASVFALLDDHARLSAHMSRRSWRMGWGRMEVRTDDGAGRAVGSHIRLEGRVLGIRLGLDEVVTEHAPPMRKTWETSGVPRLLVIGPYRMGFVLTPSEDASGRRSAATLMVFIDYALPDRGVGRLLGRLFGHRYAGWCTRRMVADARAAFSANAAEPARVGAVPPAKAAR